MGTGYTLGYALNRGMIPAPPICQRITDYLKKTSGEDGPPGPGSNFSSSWAKIQNQLADDAGMARGTLYEVLRGRRTWLQFDFADRLICLVVGPEAWYEPDLHDYYMGVNLNAKPVGKKRAV